MLSNDIKVSPTPIQRNAFDVAVELTKMNFKTRDTTNPDEIAEVFVKFLAAAILFKGTDYNTLRDLLPDKLKNVLPK